MPPRLAASFISVWQRRQAFRACGRDGDASAVLRRNIRHAMTSAIWAGVTEQQPDGERHQSKRGHHKFFDRLVTHYGT